MKNMGFNPKLEVEHSSVEDYVLGSTKTLTGVADKISGIVGAVYAWPSPKDGVYPRVLNKINHAIDFVNEMSKKYLPDGTVQRGSQDWMNCATNAPLNELEKQFNYAIEKGFFTDGLVEWFKEVGFINNGKFEIADAFNTILSGTTRNGNSLKSPIESIRIDGIIPKSVLPDSKSMNWSQYHNPNRVTNEMLELGQEVKKYIEFGYQKVSYSKFNQFLDIKWDIMDSYVDRVDGDFIKRLASNYNIMSYGYHLTINQINEPKKEENNMKVEIEVVKKLNSPDYLLRDKKEPSIWHRLGNEKVFTAIAGDFPEEIEELDIADENIKDPIYFSSSLLDIIVSFFSKLKGN